MKPWQKARLAKASGPRFRTYAGISKALRSADALGREDAIATLRAKNTKKAADLVAKHIGGEADPGIRRFCIGMLSSMTHKPKNYIPVLKKHTFDFDRVVRGFAAEALAGEIGWKRTVQFISENFKDPANVPRAFFAHDDFVGGLHRPRKWRKEDWRALEKQAAIDARQDGLRPMLDKNSKQVRVNGIPVFLGEIGRSIGRYGNGRLTVESRERKLREEFRQAIAWHEFGETFSHGVGRAFEYASLIKTGNFRAFLKRYPKVRNEFQIIQSRWERKK